MTAAAQEDARERQLRSLRKQIQAILPHPLSNSQRASLDEVIAMNLSGVGA